jgi:hypothetical protein
MESGCDRLVEKRPGRGIFISGIYLMPMRLLQAVHVRHMGHRCDFSVLSPESRPADRRALDRNLEGTRRGIRSNAHGFGKPAA